MSHDRAAQAVLFVSGTCTVLLLRAAYAGPCPVRCPNVAVAWTASSRRSRAEEGRCRPVDGE